jgi:hypothetical protein
MYCSLDAFGEWPINHYQLFPRACSVVLFETVTQSPMPRFWGFSWCPKGARCRCVDHDGPAKESTAIQAVTTHSVWLYIHRDLPGSGTSAALHSELWQPRRFQTIVGGFRCKMSRRPDVLALGLHQSCLVLTVLCIESSRPGRAAAHRVFARPFKVHRVSMGCVQAMERPACRLGDLG